MSKKDREYKIRVAPVANTEHHIKRPLIIDDPCFASGCELSLNRHKQPRKWSHLQLSGSSERIIYEATNYGEHSSATLPYQYAVALVDESSDKPTVTLYGAEHFVSSTRIIKLEQVAAERAVREAAKVEATKDAASASREYLKSRALLGESFGTKKTKQILGSYEKHKIDIGQLESQSGFISKNLDSSISRIAQQEDKDKEGGEDGAGGVTNSGLSMPSSDSILPPHNASGKAPKDIYKVQNIIPTAVYFSLDVQSLADAVLAKDTAALDALKEEYSLNETVDSRLRSLLQLPKTPERKALEHTLKCLVYVNYLFLFRNLNETKLNGAHLPLPHANADLASALLQQFAESVTLANGKMRYKLSTICKDRLVCYICVLVLCLDGFRTNVAQLSAALKLPVTKTSDHLRAVGCSLERPEAGEPSKYVAPGSDREIPVKMAVLKAPLKIELVRPAKGPSKGRR